MYRIKRYFYFLSTRISRFHTYNKILSILQLPAFYYLFWNNNNRRNLGALQSKTTIISTLYSSLGIHFNLNHLGSSYTNNKNNTSVSQRMEKEVVEWVKKVFRVKDSNIEGYITSGGTESNLFLSWSIRELFTKGLTGTNGDNCCLVVNNLTHYSIIKAARIQRLNTVNVVVNPTSLSIDVNSLYKNLIKTIRKGTTNIIIPVTLGYSSFGSIDPLDSVIKVLKTIKIKWPTVKFAVWIDASGQGLPMAFLDAGFSPFKYKYVYGLCIDFHKLGRSPIPSGVVIFKKSLRKAVQNDIDYLAEKDVTISGSRPGFSSMAIWANIFSLPYLEWKRSFQSCEKTKNEFILQFRSTFPEKNVISSPNSLTCAIIVDRDFKKLPESIEGKYSLYLGRVKINSIHTIAHYKIHFTPQIKSDIVSEFINDIVKYQKSRVGGKNSSTIAVS